MGVVNENVPFSWTVKKAGFLTRYGTFPVALSLADVTVPVTLVAGVNGTVTDGVGGAGVVGASMALCPTAATLPTSPGCTPLSPSGAGGAFTITNDLVPDTYKVFASTALVPAAPPDPAIPAKRGSTTLTIAANGDASLAGAIAIVAIP
jgi:hypothetical protein